MGLVTDDAHRFAPAAPHEEYVYGACSPGWHSAADNPTAVDQWLSFVRSKGIRRVCCLLAESPGHDGDSNVDRYREAFGPPNVRHVPVADHRLVGADRLRADVLPFLDGAVADDDPVVVHCLTGVGRTGQVLAAWLVHRHEYRPPEAVDTVREMGRDPATAVERGTATRHELLDMLGRLS